MTDHDTELVALIDNELDGDAKGRLLAGSLKGHGSYRWRGSD
jgi:hypothetical protein